MPGSGQGIDAQFLHRVMFKIIGDESKLVVDGDGGDRGVGGRQGNAFAGIVTLEIAFGPPDAIDPPTSLLRVSIRDDRGLSMNRQRLPGL